MTTKFGIVLILWIYLMINQAIASTFGSINIENSGSQATIILFFNQKPIYAFFSLHNPERVVIDISHIVSVEGLPLEFKGNNIIKRMRTSKSIDEKSVRLVFELTNKSYVKATARKIGKFYNVTLTITNQQPAVFVSFLRPPKTKLVSNILLTQTAKNQSTTRMKIIEDHSSILIKKSASISILKSNNKLSVDCEPLVVAIDAGHGGQDPGATGHNGLYEKNVTIAIAQKLKNLLNADTMFRAVLTRDSDYFISVIGRSDVARKKGASVLVSIHADAAPNRNASGASVWILSNRRANSEMATWLEQHEKQCELLGDAGDLLINNRTDPYLSQVMLDLQFGHSQRVGYDIAVKILKQLQKVGTLHKHQPEYASLGVLRSLDIPSLLVETGFISNNREEYLLGNSAYQDKIARALYLGLRTYFLTHPLQIKQKFENQLNSISIISSSTVKHHIVKRGETLSSIAHQYGISIVTIQTMNSLQKDSIMIGQRLYIPSNKTLQKTAFSFFK